jgi:hypothetical protein
LGGVGVSHELRNAEIGMRAVRESDRSGGATEFLHGDAAKKKIIIIGNEYK